MPEHPAPRFQLGDPGYGGTQGFRTTTCTARARGRSTPTSGHGARVTPTTTCLSPSSGKAMRTRRSISPASQRKKACGCTRWGPKPIRLFRTRPGGDYWVNHFGTELQSMVDRVRAVYSGLLTYDMQYKAYWRDWFAPGSWHLWEDLDLDVIGVSAWFPLVDEPPTTVMDVDSLRREYERIFRNHLVPMAERNPGRPLVFLEYAAVDTVEAPAGPTFGRTTRPSCSPIRTGTASTTARKFRTTCTGRCSRPWRRIPAWCTARSSGIPGSPSTRGTGNHPRCIAPTPSVGSCPKRPSGSGTTGSGRPRGLRGGPVGPRNDPREGAIATEHHSRRCRRRSRTPGRLRRRPSNRSNAPLRRRPRQKN